jgi:hypothetical protein
MAKIDLSDKAKAKMREIYWKGVTPKDIATRFDCGVQLVRDVINSQRQA